MAGREPTELDRDSCWSTHRQRELSQGACDDLDLQGGTPPAVEWELAPLDLVPVVAVVHDKAILTKAEHRRTGERQTLTVLDPGRPPLDGRPVACRERLAEPTLDTFLYSEVLRQVTAHACLSHVRLAERKRPV